MTIDEAIEQEKFKARVDRIKSNKKIFHNNDEDEISACHRSAEEHERLAEWLEELKAIKSDEFTDDLLNMGFTKGYNKALEELKVIKEMDLSIPHHFTKEQSDWIKKYCINRNKEFYNKALDDFVKFASDMPTVEEEDGTIRPMWLEEMAERLKEQEK